MVMKESVVKKIIIALVIIGLFIPVGIEMYKGATSKIETIAYSEISNIVKESGNNYGFSLVYVSPESNENAEEVKQEVLDTVSSFNSITAGEALTASFVDYDSLSDSEKKEVFGDSTDKVAYITIYNGSKIRTVQGSMSTSQLREIVSADSGNGISSNLVNYKVAKDAAEYQKLVKDKKKVTMAVLGRDSCTYCNMFKVIYNKVTKDYGLENVYYFNSDSYDKDEYTKVLSTDLVVPSACLDNKGDKKLSEANFGTPLTLFTKNGKVIGCIGGFVNEEKLVTKLKEVGMIKE